MKSGALLTTLFLMATAGTLFGRQAPDDFKSEWLRQFDYSAGRLNALAEAMPAEKYAWSPGEGVMSVERVFAHISRYNYFYPASSLSKPAPDGVDVEQMESATGKEQVTGMLAASLAHVRSVVEAMTQEELEAETTLYGREVQGWSVLLQLLAHMNEHLGQSIAYARLNGVVPPWSR